MLPIIVEEVITCARQRIALQGHQQDKIEFATPPTHNEGNFISILRLLSKCNSDLKEHLLNGPKNARYISKTIQNEILGIAADQIREFYRRCLRKSPHFSIMADDVTSHGKEILAVCVRFLEVDHTDFQTKPHKHEALVDFCFLTRITGESIAEGILKVLENHQINIKNCRGQAYDTSSMSSPRAGVQSHIKEHAPDADYQGCCLHSLNLVICSSTKISAIRNMFDSCQQAFLYFRNSPKRQRFLKHVINHFCPEMRKKLATDVGSKEEMPRVIHGRQTRPNPDVTCPYDYWRMTITIPFLDSIIMELETRFTSEKRAHFELCGLIPEVIKNNRNVSHLNEILFTKWSHLLLAGDNLVNYIVGSNIAVV